MAAAEAHGLCVVEEVHSDSELVRVGLKVQDREDKKKMS